MKKFKTFLLACLSILTITNPNIKKVNAETTYEIYPTVQNISYKNYNLTLSNKINIVYDNTLDIYTKNKTIEVLSTKNLKATFSNEIDNNKNNILLGIYKNNSIINDYVTTNLDFIDSMIDAYYLSIDEKNIVIIGKDTDSVFYGLSTLDLIFKQTDTIIRGLEIKDYASSYYRGFIEGYYGIPWTSEERKELMRFGSKFKSNIYIYAPKDDAYHSSSWRQLYSQNDLEILKEQIDVGLQTKTQLAWAIHPFMSNKITLGNYSDSLLVIKNKFSQLYDAGIRQFVISADDVEVSDGLLEDGSLHKNLLNDLTLFLKTKEGTKDLIFVPSAYCYQAEQRLKVDLKKYYSSLMDGLDSSIHIMWTGDDVCSSMKTGRFTEFEQLTNKKPFFWLNWPVNDYSTDHLLMGKGEVLNVKYSNNVAFEGIVTNPMQQAEPSKLSIFTICDYSWNANKFDMNKSYNDSFKYIEEKEFDSLKLISSHLTNATLYEGKYFEEAPELVDLIYKYNQEKNENNYNNLISYFNKMITNINDFINNCSNIKLKESMLPWINALLDASKAINTYLNILKNFSNLSKTELKNLLDEGNLYFENSQKHEEPVLDVITYNIKYRYADYGVSVLKPFLQKISSRANDEVKLELGLPTGIIYNGFESIYQGSLENIIDNDDSTYCWFGSNPSKDAYIRIDLEEIKDIHDIRILFGNSNGATDYLVGELYVSNDAKNYTLIGELNKADVLFDLRDNPIKARYLLLKNTSTETWVSIKEVKYNTLSLDEITVTQTGFTLVPNNHDDISKIIDGDLSTYVWFDWHFDKNSAITLDLRQIKTINKIKFYQRVSEHESDVFQNCSFYISKDNVTYTKVGEDQYLSQDEIEITLTNTEARYVQIRSNVYNEVGVCIREFIVE